MDVSAAQQRLVKIVQGDVYFDDIELLMLDEVADDQIKGAAVRQGVARPPDQIPGRFQIQLQRKGEGDGRGLGGSGIGIVDELGEVLLGNVCFL